MLVCNGRDTVKVRQGKFDQRPGKQSTGESKCQYLLIRFTGALWDGSISRQLHLAEYSDPTGKPDEAKVSRPVWSRGKAARPDLLLRTPTEGLSGKLEG
jgi:hypothetical protein